MSHRLFTHVRNGNNSGGGAPSSSGASGGVNANNFGGIENSVDTSWSFQYGTYPFLHGEEDALVFLDQCHLSDLKLGRNVFIIMNISHYSMVT